MADRGATAAVRAEWGAAQTRVVHLMEMYLDSTTVRASDAPFRIEWQGNAFLPNGQFLNFSGVEDSAELRDSRVTVTLSGVDQVHISDALQEKYLERRFVIYRAFLDAANALILDPVPLFDGKMDKMRIAEDPSPGATPGPGIGNCSVTVEATAHWSDFGRRPGRHTNDNEQKLHFPGDKFFEFASEINKPILWGRAP